MTFWQTIIIAIVEGLTEFLPVSSTGHMIITQSFLGIESTEFVKAFTVIIQFGAILSVIVLYWNRFFRLQPLDEFNVPTYSEGKKFVKQRVIIRKFFYRYDFYWKLLIGFLPAAVIGFLAGDFIDVLLGDVFVVALMLFIGGFVMLFVDKWFSASSQDQSIGWQRALKIGFFQCIAMIPGVSRSMATIVGGMAVKLTRKNAAEFSFFLAVPTMAAASGYKLFQLLSEQGGKDLLVQNWLLLLLGNVIAFIVALVAIRFFIDFISRYGFKAFGYYRIAVGGVILLLLGMGYNLNMM
ncbi:MAG TPA: undecaprenyl-diphosphate phosphatase [Paludibacteraceae bacterium]|nr:undecaprenyl-diphosphate phosphatase [Paludibacteraceae bacterium]HOF98508.1 undecaprenyl-diphosphate phosphatase [Paludibacteraceae bacterium]HOJ66109.1 undecaprenyl-diphosphate phosphatase [Paludibacteraceae bacterium]HOL29449.1 undecaprenyl-diphosphate phosphatase [Paludibacteraceae bacterium]HON01515.1 undecaprenyl-diphosphate phosphatase [Paludibacteraceae bacterium]